MAVPSNPFVDSSSTSSATTAPSNPFIPKGEGGGTSFESSQEDTSPPVPAHPVTDELADLGRHAFRGAMKGLGDIADIPGDVWDVAFHPEEGPTPMAHLVAEKIADKITKPKSNSSLGRIVESGAEGLPMGLLGGVEGAIPSMVSSGASQAAKEAGAGPTGQFVAGMAPFAPAAAAAGIKGLVRGGSQGAEAMQQNLNNAQNAGIKLSAGQASGNSLLRGAETLGSKIPGGGPLAATRGAGLNNQVEQSVSNIVKNLAPDMRQNPPTPTTAGESVRENVKGRLISLKDETDEAADAMHEAVGGKNTPMAAPKLEATLAKVTGSTGIEQIDNLVTGAKTKAVAKTVKGITDTPTVPVSYSYDEGIHTVKSPNGITEAKGLTGGGIRVFNSETAEGARGAGEATSRMETLGHIATSHGQPLVSDNLVSQAETHVYDKLGRRGWNVEKNPGTYVDDNGNLRSNNPLKPVYTVTAPKTQGTGQPVSPTPSSEKQFTGEWTYNPTTGKSEPVTTTPDTTGPQQQGQKAVLNQPTPYTFDGLRQLRTIIGRGISSTRDLGQQAQLKQLYGSLSEDLKDGVNAKGPHAAEQYELFNQIANQNAQTRKVLLKSIKEAGGPEFVFTTAMAGSKAGASKISPIMQSLDEPGRNFFRATVLNRLGRAGGALDRPFDANTYMNNWRNMSPEAKNVLFGEGAKAGPPIQLRKSLDSLSDTLDLLQKQGQVKSGFVKGIQEGNSTLHKVGIFGVLALLAEGGGQTVAHIAEGHPMLAAGAATGAVGALAGNPIMSRVLTNPKLVGWMAQAAKAPRGSIPVLLNQLNQMGQKDPDAKDLASLIGNQ